MKKNILLTVFCCLLGILSSAGQNDANDSILLQVAFRNFYGINKPLNYERAYRIFSALAQKNNPVALNALGLMYKNGTGVEQNLETAVSYFYRAHKNGSNAGTFNLAMAYRTGSGVNQHYRQAILLFYEAAKNGYPEGCYNTGEMIYKGFGTKQDYEAAMRYFEAGAAAGNKSCLFMLGVAYCEGHGKKQDLAKSEYYFNLALKAGHSWVKDVIEKGTIDSVAQRKARYAERSKRDTLVHAVNNAECAEMEGKWSGTLTTYDWSGKEIYDETALTLEIENHSDSVFVKWIENDTEKYRFFARNDGKRWQIRQLDSSDDDEAPDEILKTIIFNISESSGKEKLLAGNILMASEYTRDNLNPRSFKLNYIDAAGETEGSISIVGAFPNPFKNDIRLSIKLNEKDKIGFEIYDIYGSRVYSKPESTFKAGVHTLTLQLRNLPEGNYIVYVKGKTVVKSNVLVKSKN